MIERERAAAHGDPEAEARLWLAKLAEVDRNRARYQEMDAAERQHVYRMLRVEAAVAPDGSLEISGDVISVCEMETSSL